MAIPQLKNGNGKSQSSSSARFRQRKISVKQPLTIYKQKDLPAADLANELEPSQVNHLNSNGQQRDLHSFETGVDKNEEDEVHLQQVINAAQKALLSSKEGRKDESKEEDLKKAQVYIPTPDASKIWLEASKYYNDHTFIEPEANIKYSAQVEDAIGVAYNMDEIDEEFLNEMNKTHPLKKNEAICNELEFEIVVDKLETLIEEKQPFLSMDPTNILSYKELSSYIIEEFKSSHKNNPYIQIGSNLKYMSSMTLKERLAKELNFHPFVTTFDKDPLNHDNKDTTRTIIKLLDLFGEPIYNHWKARKIERKGKSIIPSLKFEDPNANEKDNDNDPYVCFRRREFRQARKTRRADTIGIEKIRLLQKSLHRVRDLMFNVSQREILKLEAYKMDLNVFKLRCEAKTLKRSQNIVGDDHLFYPHKKKKIIKIKEEEEREREEARAKRERRLKEFKDSTKLNQMSQVSSLVDNGSSTQPYVKLPPSKIPDMDLITVSLVLKEKQDTIKRAVLDKLRKRKELDDGYINLTDNPYQPYFNILTNFHVQNKELTHSPYSAIGMNNLHQINSSSVLNEALVKLLEEGKKPLPEMRTFSGKTGELIPSEAFPHLNTLLNDVKNRSASGYISQLLKNIESNNYDVYVNGFETPEVDEELNRPNISDAIFRLRRRTGRLSRNFIDRRLPKDLSQFIDDGQEGKQGEEGNEIIDVYDALETSRRAKSNWKFDNESSEYETNLAMPFSLDPSRLNSICEDTQSIRFGSMLLSKSYELLRESVHNRQQAFMQQARLRALHQQQQHQLRNKTLTQVARPSNSSTSGSSTGSGSESASLTGSGSGSGSGSSQAKLNRSNSMTPPIRAASNSARS